MSFFFLVFGRLIIVRTEFDLVYAVLTSKYIFVCARARVYVYLFVEGFCENLNTES